METPDLDQLLVELQSRVAFQEDALDQLDAVVREQERRIASLVSALEHLSRRLDGARTEDDPAGHEPPPHY